MPDHNTYQNNKILISTVELLDSLDDPNVKVFDTAVYLTPNTDNPSIMLIINSTPR